MHKVLVCGAGKIGEAIAALLLASKRYSITVADNDLGRAQSVAYSHASRPAVGGPSEGIVQSVAISTKDAAAMSALVGAHDAVISALPFHCNPDVAHAARSAGKHYLDLTEDVETTKTVATLSQGAGCGFMPQCGLAPGFISIAALSLADAFERVEHVRLRVGALPVFPSNRARYNLTWSTEGLINEYGNLCEGIVDGKKLLLQPLEGYETFLLDGEEYEAFNTSGGLGTLCDSLAGRARNVDYKSIRFKGHRDLIAFLMTDLGFDRDRDALRKIFERSIPTTPQDKVVIRAEVVGQRKGKLSALTYASTIYNQPIGGRHFTAIQITTAAGICAPLDLLLTGKLEKRSGFLKCEDISLKDFLANEFGALYLDKTALSDPQVLS